MSAARSSKASRRESQAKESLITPTQISGTQEYRSRCFNIRQLFAYRPATQQQLRAFLFSDSERYSTFIVKEELKKKREEAFKRKHEEYTKKNVKFTLRTKEEDARPSGKSEAAKTHSSVSRTRSVQQETNSVCSEEAKVE